MAILDKTLIFSDEQAETTVAAHDSANTIDTGAADSNIGAGRPKYLIVEVHTAFASSGAATLSVALQDCATEGGTYADLVKSEAYAVGACGKGKKLLCVPIPSEHARYLKCVYTIGGAAMTAGKLDAYITLDPQLH